MLATSLKALSTRAAVNFGADIPAKVTHKFPGRGKSLGRRGWLHSVLLNEKVLNGARQKAHFSALSTLCQPNFGRKPPVLAGRSHQPGS
jgi:hypothetical protein